MTGYGGQNRPPTGPLPSPGKKYGVAPEVAGCPGYSTVTDFARLRGWSTSVPFATATWYASNCTGTA